MSENVGKRKPENSRWNLLLILDVLKEHTDEEHPLSASEICGKVNQKFAQFADGDASKVMSADTVKRTLDALARDFFDRCDPLRQALDFGVYSVVKADGAYRRYGYGDEGDAGLKRCYYYEGKFSAPEIRTLIDAIETYSYFNDEDVCTIVRKLIHLRPYAYKGRQYFDCASEDRDDNSLLMSNIDYLCERIDRREHVEIEYCYYNEAKELTLRPGYPKVVEPLTMMWSNGYYYLLAYNDKYDNIVNYRIDRIREMRAVEADKKNRRPASERPQINPVKYRMEHPVMYGGKKERFVLLCRDTGKNYIVNTIMDVFGKGTKIVRASDKLLLDTLGHDRAYYEKDGIRWLRLSFESTSGGVEMWATQYCADCVIVQPEESRQRVKKRLQDGIKNYGIL